MLSTIEALSGLRGAVDVVSIQFNAALTSLRGCDGIEVATHLIVDSNKALINTDGRSPATVVSTVQV